MKNDWYAEAESLKREVLNRLESMPPEARRLPPGPRDWSAAQVVGHLVLLEELTVSDWHIAARNFAAVKPGWRGTLVVRMVNFAMTTPLRLPTRPFLEPTGSLELSDLSDRWQTVRERLPGTFPPDNSALWIMHPILGPLSCEQMGTFLVAHLQHHLKHWSEKIPPHGDNAVRRPSVSTKGGGASGQ